MTCFKDDVTNDDDPTGPSNGDFNDPMVIIGTETPTKTFTLRPTANGTTEHKPDQRSSNILSRLQLPFRVLNGRTN